MSTASCNLPLEASTISPLWPTGSTNWWARVGTIMDPITHHISTGPTTDLTTDLRHITTTHSTAYSPALATYDTVPPSTQSRRVDPLLVLNSLMEALSRWLLHELSMTTLTSGGLWSACNWMTPQPAVNLYGKKAPGFLLHFSWIHCPNSPNATTSTLLAVLQDAPLL